MEVTVSRTGRCRWTLHSGSETTAREDAREELAAGLEEDEHVVDWKVENAEVDEHPTAPFEPYTIAFAVSVTVELDVGDREEAAEIGVDTIHDVLERAGVDGVTYTAEPTVSST
ncbi:hypothetical protein [Natronorubrum daqingense]|uniref:Uncharacterized protein n=1 Tax=Natronorubrum daqingense TaxID=588898 RepID=A0A1N6ZWT6_9EURY|nr:hypothetical protein [Natronorubrum daqingense]APX95221.1 hypothetical protein BB347_00600 [Natronorubrum daqingense]SIR31213.1 hypothetical protein SAMN05421809_0944 [Natronorubrum daqingense]